MQHEMRRAPGSEVRITEEDGNRYLTVRAITPGVVDDYGSLWDPHTFDASAESRMPTLTWGHDWTEPIGRAVDYTPSDDGPTLRFRVDDHPDVPQARRAIAQVESGTLDDVSVGFSGTRRRDPTDDERAAYPGVLEVIEQANLDEVALVLRGAVPGAKVLQLRSGKVEGNLVVDLAKQVAAGELSNDEAVAALRLATQADDPDDPEPEVEPVDDEPVEELPDVDAALAQVMRGL